MRELEEVNCEIRRVIDIQPSVSFRLNSFDGIHNDVSNELPEDSSPDLPSGGFLNQANYAWLSYASRLVVFNVRTGENISSWTFRDRVTSVSQFPVQPGELPLLLVGLDNGAIRVKDSLGMVCVFDCATSRILRAIKMPAGVEQVSVVSGGTEWEEFSEKRPDSVLPNTGGIACVALRNLQHIVISLQRHSWDAPNLSVLMDESSPAQLEFATTKDSRGRNQPGKEKHAAINLLNTRIERHIAFNREDFEANAFLGENLTTALVSSTKIGCLISGCLGRVILWENNGRIGWISPPIDETMTVTHLALLEPTDDPRPYYYLWAVFQDEASKLPPLLRMYALLFERKYCDRGTNLYFNLEAEPSLKFEFELDTVDRIVSLSTIERESSPEQTDTLTKRGEDNLLLIVANDRTLLFDLNQWYKEQMPQSISECQNPNSILACYRTQQPPIAGHNEAISCSYIPSTLREFPNDSPNSSEELYYPNSLSLEWVELTATKLTFWMSRGIQAELLRDMAIAGPIILTQPAETFHKCLSVGLVPFNVEVSFTNDHNVQREMLLSLCLEQRWATFLVRCAKEWSDGSAAYLYPGFVKWGVQRASSIKMVADRLCIPLFDQSGNNIDESEVKTLRFCSQQLECLSNVVAKLPFETSDLVKQRRALRRVSTYLQVLLWFYDVGLLPESQEIEDGPLPISLALRIPYPFARLFSMYKEKREELKRLKEDDGNEDLFIDELIMRECSVLKLQWEREACDNTSNGYYPPPSLQSLLRSYLASSDRSETEEIECKHQITIYLLMDLAMLLQGSYPGVNQLIKYPSAFKMSPSLIKLTQAFWLLDHEDYQGFLDTMTGQLVSDADIKDWHHKLVLRTLVRKNQHKLALTYLHLRKPPLSSVSDQSALIRLSVEHGLVQSAFHRRPQSHYAQLLISFFQASKQFGKLNDILHLALDTEEEEVFVKFLEEEKATDIRLLYYLQRSRYTEANNGKSFGSSNSVFPKEHQGTSQTMLNAYKATLPDVIKRFSVSMARSNLDMDAESRYPRPMSHRKSCNKTLSVHENVVRKAQETHLRREKAQIPFISAPCVSLKLNEAHLNSSCVHFPQLADRNHKRTLEQMYDGDESTIETPEGAKRRKLEDREGSDVPDSKSNSFNVALSTPLVRRKNNVAISKDVYMETPQSILKIRQMIRNSTSPTVGTSQSEATDNFQPEKEKKISRQIRFSIGQSRRSLSNEEVSGATEEVSSTKAHVSGETEEAFSNETHMETAILSDDSYCSNRTRTPRPRPSLRRICLDSTKDLLEEPVNKFLRRASLVNTPVRTPGKRGLNASVARSGVKGTPRRVGQDDNSLSTSVYTPSILCDYSTAELNVVPWNSKDLKRRPLIFTDEDNGDHRYPISSTPHSKILPKQTFDEAMDVDEVPSKSREVKEEEQPDEMEVQEENLAYEEPAVTLKEHCKYKNGSVTQSNVSYEKQFEEAKAEDTKEDEQYTEANEEEDDEVEEFKSLSTVNDSSIQSEKKDRFSWLHKEEITKSSINKTTVTPPIYDITDDESAVSEDEMVLALEESKQDPAAIVPLQENVFDVSNITDDESDTEEPEKRSEPQEEQSVYEESNRSKRSNEIVVSRTDTEDREQLESLADVSANPVDTESKESELSKPKQQELRQDLNETQSKETDSGEEVNVRMTRSRRASSIAKDIPSPSLNSPSKATERRSMRRASSLAKELLSASVLGTDDRLKPRNSSGSEDSMSLGTPKKGRERRAASVAKESLTPQSDETEAQTPVRRVTRRAASVQKELAEVPKALTRRDRVSSVSSLTSEPDEEATITKGKHTRRKNVSSESKKTTSRSTRATKTQSVEEEEPEEVVKPVKRRGGVQETLVDTPRSRRAASLAKEIETEVLSKSPATNTRSRRSSIQSIPEELEEVLSVPTKSRTSAKEANSRQRRAVSMEPERKKTLRSVRGRSILKETIAEEDTGEVEADTKTSTAKKPTARRTRKTSETITQDVEATTKTKRGRKVKATQDTSNQFSFSQPDKTSNMPADQKGALSSVVRVSNSFKSGNVLQRLKIYRVTSSHLHTPGRSLVQPSNTESDTCPSRSWTKGNENHAGIFLEAVSSSMSC